MSVTETNILRLSRRIKAVEEMASPGDISLCEVGAITLWPMQTPPKSWLVCDGREVSRSEYAQLFGKLCSYKCGADVSIGSPAVVTLSSHGFCEGDSVFFTTTGALPTGLSANTLYYIKFTDADTFNLSLTRGGEAVNTSGQQSGVHSVYACPWGIGDGCSTFNLPDLKGKVAVGKDAGDFAFNNIGKAGGEKAHSLTAEENGTHTHTQNEHTHVQNAHSHTQDSHSHGRGTLDISISSGGSHTHSYQRPSTAESAAVGSGNFVWDNSTGSYNVGNGGEHSHTGSVTGSISSATATNQSTAATNQNAAAANQDSGNGDAHNNLQPYVVLNFIIRYQSYAAPKKGDKGDKGEKGDSGRAGEAAPYVKAQYSQDGESWHDDHTAGDFYIRFSADGGNFWDGAIHIRGPQGVQGPKGNTGETGVSYRMIGAYDAEASYVNGLDYIDCVTYYGSSYYARQNTTGNSPGDNEYWGVLAQKGLDGQGVGDVIGPAANSDGKFPQWDGSGTKTLKDGYSLQDIILAMYPVGSVYISVVNTPPQTLFGGTWAAIAPGKLLAGYDAGDEDFDTAEATGGEKAHTLLEAEMPQHTHSQNSHCHSISHDHGAVTSGSQSVDHTHGVSINAQSNGSHSHNIRWYQGEYVSLSGNGSGDSSSGYRTGYSSGTVYHSSLMAASAGAHTHLVSGDTDAASAGHTHSVDLPLFSGDSGSSAAENQNTGAGTAHNNMPPYIVVYMWKRTA